MLFLASGLWAEVAFHSAPARLEVKLGLRWGWRSRSVVLPFWHWTRDADLWLRAKEPKRSPGSKSFTPGLRPRLVISLAAALLRGLSVSLSGRIRFGTGDAASTGFVVGLAWVFLGLAQSFVRVACRGAKTEVKLEPEFERSLLEANIRCIVSVPVIHIISVAALAVTYLRQELADSKKQGGKKRWRSIPFKA